MKRYVVTSGDAKANRRHLLPLGQHLPALYEQRYVKDYVEHPL